MFKALMIRVVLVTFLVSSVGPMPLAQAQAGLNLPAPGQMILQSQAFKPLELKGIQLNPKNPLRFDFLVDRGNSSNKDQSLKDEITQLTKYFLTCLTVPEKDLWVNLSPYEKDRIAPDGFGVTEMGKALLEQDYLLKQMMASLSYPENKVGQEFWQKVYLKAQQLYGTTNIPMSSFNKVWIVPKSAQVYINGNGAFISDSKLEVMLETDYKALTNHMGKDNIGPEALANLNSVKNKEAEMYAQMVRDVILPELRREVNEGSHFAVVRQVYTAMILATWFKRHLKNSLLDQVYVGKNKVAGIDVNDKSIKEKIFQQYLTAYKKCVYNYIREDYNPATQTMIPRKYASGGMDFVQFGLEGDRVYSETDSSKGLDLGQDLTLATINLGAASSNGTVVNFPDNQTGFILGSEGKSVNQVITQSVNPFNQESFGIRSFTTNGIYLSSIVNGLPEPVTQQEIDRAQLAEAQTAQDLSVPLRETKVTQRHWMDVAGWMGGMTLAAASYGADPFSLLATAVVLPFLTRLLYAAQVWVHEVIGHALPAAVLHPKEMKQAFSTDNLRGNFDLRQWLQVLFPGMAPQENPYISFAAEGWRDEAIRKSGFLVTALVGVLATVGALVEGFQNNWMLPLVGPLAISAWEVIKASWSSDIQTDSKEGKYDCGNYGVFWVGTSQEGTNPKWVREGLNGLLRRLIVRGGQSAGELSIIDGKYTRKGLAVPYLTKVVKTKRGGGSDLVGTLLKDFNKNVTTTLKGVGDNVEVVMGTNGHVRYATGGPVTKNASHPHMGPQEKRTQWTLKDGRFVAEQKNVFVVVTHNGDNDEYNLLDRNMTLSEMREYFGKMTHMKKNVWIPPVRQMNGPSIPGHYDYMAQGDSPVIAPQIHFHLTQGSWRASVRFAHVMNDKQSVQQAMQEILTVQEEDAVAGIFDKVFQKHAAVLNRPGLQKENKSFKDLWVTQEMVDRNVGYRAQFDVINAFKADVLSQIEAEIASNASTGGKLLRQWHRTAEARQRFVDMTVEKFFTGDRWNATQEFRERASGSYGLVVRTSLQNDGVTIFSKAQGMTLGYNMRKKFFAFASDPLVLQAPFGDRGRLEELFILDPRESGEVADIGFSGTGQFYMRIFSSEKKRELTGQEVVDRQYPLNERNPYYAPPVEYADPKRIIDDDLENATAALAGRVNAWSKPDSLDRQSGEAMVELEVSRYIEVFLKENSLTYPLIRSVMMKHLNDLLDECSAAGSGCSAEQIDFLKAEMLRASQESIIAGYIERKADKFLAQEADHIGAELRAGFFSDEKLYEISKAVDERLKAMIEKQMSGVVEELSSHFDQAKTRWEKVQADYSHGNMSKKTDLFLSGYEKSLWLAENLKQMILTFMPKKTIEVTSSNKKLKDPFQFGIHDRTIGLIVSLSGSTFPSLALANFLKKMTNGNTFVMTSRMDAMINMALGQRLNPDAPFTKRIFLTGNYYPSEAAPTADLLLYAEQIMMVIYLVKRLRAIFPHHNPWGLNVNEAEIKRLEGLVQGMIADSRKMTGFNEQTKKIKEEVNQKLVKRGEYLAGHLREAPEVNFLFRAFVFGVFIFGAPIHKLFSLFGMDPGPALGSWGGFAVASADALFAMGVPFLITTLLYRTFTGRPRWARMGAPTMVIGDNSANHQIMEAYVSKLGANAPGSMSMDVHGGNPEDHLGARFAHRIVRGTELVVGMPTEGANKDATIVSLKQAKGIVNGIAGNHLMGGAEITTIGREDFVNKDATDFHINIEGQRITPEDTNAVRRFNYLSFDAFGRLMAYKVMFNAMYAKASSLTLVPSFTINLGLFKVNIEARRFFIWDRAWTYPSISVHTTRSPIGISNQVEASVDKMARTLGTEDKDQAMNVIVKPEEPLTKGGIDLDSQLMKLDIKGEDHFQFTFDQRDSILASMQGLVPQVDSIVTVTPSMLQTMLETAHIN